jgi:lysozyme family protein
LGFEGGLVDDPQDRGGRTNFGITQPSYDAWRKQKGLAARPVDQIEDHEVSGVYEDNYWTPCACELLPERLGQVVFDMAVNSGTWNAKLTLQRALRVCADGVVGPLTIKAAQDPDAVLRFLKLRGAFIQEIILTRPGQAHFLEGWINRLLEQAWRQA